MKKRVVQKKRDRTRSNELPCPHVTITEHRKTARTFFRMGITASVKDARTELIRLELYQKRKIIALTVFYGVL